MLIRRPEAIDLFLKELRGSFAGPALYRLSQAQAVALGDAFPVPVPRRAPPQPAGDESDNTRTYEVDLAGASAPLVGLTGVGHVRVGVKDRGRLLGEVTMEVHDGTVGVDRLHDVIAVSFLVNLLGANRETARRESSAILREQLNNF
jgi:hypothetical protein